LRKAMDEENWTRERISRLEHMQLNGAAPGDSMTLHWSYLERAPATPGVLLDMSRLRDAPTTKYQGQHTGEQEQQLRPTDMRRSHENYDSEGCRRKQAKTQPTEPAEAGNDSEYRDQNYGASEADQAPRDDPGCVRQQDAEKREKRSAR